MRVETKCDKCGCVHPRDEQKYPGPIGRKHEAPCVKCTVDSKHITGVVRTPQTVVGFL